LKTIQIIIAGAILLASATAVFAEKTATMGISIEDGRLSVGDKFNATIWLDPVTPTPVQGFKIGLLEWEPNILKVVNKTVGYYDWIHDLGYEGTNFIKNIQAGEQSNTTVNQTVCIITFEVIGYGTCTISLLDVEASDGNEPTFLCNTLGKTIVIEGEEEPEEPDPPEEPPYNPPENPSEPYDEVIFPLPVINETEPEETVNETIEQNTTTNETLGKNTTIADMLDDLRDVLKNEPAPDSKEILRRQIVATIILGTLVVCVGIILLYLLVFGKKRATDQEEESLQPSEAGDEQESTEESFNPIKRSDE